MAPPSPDPHRLPTAPWLPALLSLQGACASPSPIGPQVHGEVTEQSLLWSGFSHEWAYNHRVNRLGDYAVDPVCDLESCAVDVTHTAASGSGSDTAAYDGAGHWIAAPGVGFLQGVSRFDIDAERAEGELLEHTLVVEIPSEGLLANRRQYAALLGGIDVVALEDPDKLRQLSVALGDPVADDGVVTFEVSLKLALDCDSPECDLSWTKANIFDRDVQYAVFIVWTLVAADDEMHLQSARQTESYDWTNTALGEQERLHQHTHTVDLDAPAGPYVTGALGVRAVSMTLDDDHHMVAWATRAQLLEQSPASGHATAEVALFFQQWNSSTWWKWVSYTTAGSADIEMELVWLRFAEGCDTATSWNGQIVWDANGGAADEAASEDSQTLHFDPSCQALAQ